MSKTEIVTFKTQDKERRFTICQADDEEDLLCVWCSTFRIYIVLGTDGDERHLKSIYVRENIACTSKVELSYYSVDNYPVVCIYCGIGGTHRTLNSSVEFYPKCNGCSKQFDVLRRKRKTVVESDFNKKKIK